jgi:alkylation response protein AidB-like acyl-CoA dehydrogenase
VFLARASPEVPEHQGINCFLTGMRQPGVEIRPPPPMSGEAEFFQTFLDGVRVPDSERVGAEGAGRKLARATAARPAGCRTAGTAAPGQSS